MQTDAVVHEHVAHGRTVADDDAVVVALPLAAGQVAGDQGPVLGKDADVAVVPGLVGAAEIVAVADQGDGAGEGVGDVDAGGVAPGLVAVDPGVAEAVEVDTDVVGVIAHGVGQAGDLAADLDGVVAGVVTDQVGEGLERRRGVDVDGIAGVVEGRDPVRLQTLGAAVDPQPAHAGLQRQVAQGDEISVGELEHRIGAVTGHDRQQMRGHGRVRVRAEQREALVEAEPEVVGAGDTQVRDQTVGARVDVDQVAGREVVGAQQVDRARLGRIRALARVAVVADGARGVLVVQVRGVVDVERDVVVRDRERLGAAVHDPGQIDEGHLDHVPMGVVVDHVLDEVVLRAPEVDPVVGHGVGDGRDQHRAARVVGVELDAHLGIAGIAEGIPQDRSAMRGASIVRSAWISASRPPQAPRSGAWRSWVR